MRPVDATAIDDHHHLFPGRATGGHHVMDIVPQPLRIKLRADLIEDFCGAIVDGPDETEQDPTRHPVPGAIASPCIAFAGLLMLDLTPRQGACGEAVTLGLTAPPAGAWEGKAPEDRFVSIEHNDLASTGLVLERCEFDRSVGKSRWGRGETPGGTTVA